MSTLMFINVINFLFSNDNLFILKHAALFFKSKGLPEMLWTTCWICNFYGYLVIFFNPKGMT